MLSSVLYNKLKTVSARSGACHLFYIYLLFVCKRMYRLRLFFRIPLYDNKAAPLLILPHFKTKRTPPNRLKKPVLTLIQVRILYIHVLKVRCIIVYITWIRMVNDTNWTGRFKLMRAQLFVRLE